MNAEPASSNIPVAKLSADPKLPPLPAPVIRVAVIGGRKLAVNGKDEPPPDWLGQRIKHVLAVVAKELQCAQRAEAFYDQDARPRVRVVTGLADGADQMGALAALETNTASVKLPADFELLAILPFPANEYVQTIQDQTTFWKLHNDPRTHVLVLDSQYVPNNDALDENAEANVLCRRLRQRAYRALGWFTRQQADLFIAVWQPLSQGKPGGSEDTLRRALHMGLPVVWIEPLENGRLRLLTDPMELEVLLQKGDPLDLRSDVDNAKYDFDSDLKERAVADLLRLPSVAKESGGEDTAESHGLGRMSAAMQGRSAKKGLEAPTREESLLELFHGQPLPRQVSFRGWLQEGIFNLLGGRSTKAIRSAAEELRAFDEYRNRAAGLANYYAGLYRGAFTLNYVLGALALLFAAGALFPKSAWLFALSASCVALLVNTGYARACKLGNRLWLCCLFAAPPVALAVLVLTGVGVAWTIIVTVILVLALVGLAVAEIRPPKDTEANPEGRAVAWRALRWPLGRGAFFAAAALGFGVGGMFPAASKGFVWVLALFELGCVGVILWNTRKANFHGWHARSVNYRFLTDVLRPMRYLGRLACATPLSRLPAVYEEKSPRQSWMMWLFRAVIRAAPPLPDPSAKEFHFTQAHLDRCRSDVTDCDCTLEQREQLHQGGWLSEQEDYHNRNKKRMLKAHHRIESLSFFLFLFVAIAIIVHIYLLAREILGGEEGTWGTFFAGFAILVSLWVPALALFLNGLRTQAECRRVGERSQMMLKRLGEVERPRIARLTNAALASLGSPAWTTAVEIYELAQVMIDEVADWSIMYLMHDVEAS
jgi:hypothetical protein